MSQDNVEMVRAIHDGWSRGDFGVGTELLAEGFQWQQHADAVEPGSRRGVAIGDTFKNIFAVYGDFRIEPEEFIDAGSKVLVVARIRATGRESGIGVDQRFSFVWTVRGAKLARVEVTVKA